MMRTQKGLTLLELTIAMFVLAIIMLGVVSAFASAARLNDLTAQEILVSNAIRAKVEEIRAQAKQANSFAPLMDPFDGMIARYLDDDTDALVHRSFSNSAEAADKSLLDSFSRAGMDNINATISIYLNEAAVPVEFFDEDEYAAGATTVAFDLDNDATTDAGYKTEDHKTATNNSYGVQMVPVRVRVTWEYQGESMEMSQYFFLSRQSE